MGIALGSLYILSFLLHFNFQKFLPPELDAVLAGQGQYIESSPGFPAAPEIPGLPFWPISPGPPNHFDAILVMLAEEIYRAGPYFP